MEGPCSLKRPLWITTPIQLRQCAYSDENGADQNPLIVSRVIFDELLLFQQERDRVVRVALQVIRIVLVDADRGDGLFVDVAVFFFGLNL